MLSVLSSVFENKRNAKMTKQKKLLAEKLKKNESSLEETGRGNISLKMSLLCVEGRLFPHSAMS